MVIYVLVCLYQAMYFLMSQQICMHRKKNLLKLNKLIRKIKIVLLKQENFLHSRKFYFTQNNYYCLHKYLFILKIDFFFVKKKKQMFKYKKKNPKIYFKFDFVVDKIL